MATAANRANLALYNLLRQSYIDFVTSWNAWKVVYDRNKGDVDTNSANVTTVTTNGRTLRTRITPLSRQYQRTLRDTWD